MRWRILCTVALLLALAPSAYLAWSSRDLPYLGQYQDDGLYWNAAHSLAEGQGYRIRSLPEEPFQTKYPPLFPLMLSAIVRLHPPDSESLSRAMLLVWIMLPACAVLTFRAGADLGLGPWQRLLLGLAVALSPVAALLSTNLLSELTFCCLLLSSLILAENSVRRKSGLRAFLAGVFAGLAYLTRSAGLALLLSGPIYLWWRKRRGAAILYAAAGLPALAAWNLWAQHHRSASTDLLYYTDYFRFHLRVVTLADLPRLLSTNALQLVHSAGGLILFNLYDTTWERFLCAVLGLAAIAGIIPLGLRAGVKQYHMFAVVYAIMLVAWHFPPTERFPFPVFPLILAGLLHEIEGFLGPVTNSWSSREVMVRVSAAAFVCGLIACLALILLSTGQAFASEFPANTRRERIFADARNRACRWIRVNTPASASFLAYYDTAVYLHAARHAQRPLLPVMPFYRHNRDESVQAIRSVATFCREHKIEYYFSTPADFRWGELIPEERRVLDRMLKESGDFEAVYQADGIFVYRVRY